jgi:hypothetical protein
VIDPKTLKKGDVVMFGWKIEKTVRSVKIVSDEHGYLFSEVQLDHGTEMFGDDPLWQIAELKKPELPRKVGSRYLGMNGHYYEQNGSSMTPEALLKMGKWYLSEGTDIVNKLSSFIKETE